MGEKEEGGMEEGPFLPYPFFLSSLLPSHVSRFTSDFSRIQIRLIRQRFSILLKYDRLG